MDKLQVTSIDQLMKYAEGSIIQLPPFAEGQPLVARLKRPSLLSMVAKGRIPNTLLSKAMSLFSGNQGRVAEEPDSIGDIGGLLDIFVEACLIEPTIKEINEIGLELTDEQKMFIFNYAQTGVKDLEQFRSQQGDTINY